MIAEKLRSLLRFGVLSSRYKDIFDIYYLSHHIDKNTMKKCLSVFILEDDVMRETDIAGVIKRISLIFKNKMYISNLRTRKDNWLNEDVDKVLAGILDFLKALNM